MNNIQRWRQEAGLSQSALAERIKQLDPQAKCTQALVSQWETGVTAVTPEQAVRLWTISGGAISKSEMYPNLWPAE